MKETEIDKLQELCLLLGYKFLDLKLLKKALSHRSIHNNNNERLEFLGDALLNLIIGEALFLKFTKAEEGELTRMRARLVREETVASVARKLELGKYLHLGIGELKSGGHERDSILADALEAIIAAVYLDSEISNTKIKVLSWFASYLNNLDLPMQALKDPKTTLQEYMQSLSLPVPEYKILKIEGFAHQQTFSVACAVVLLKHPIIGTGSSRRKAEQASAFELLKVLNVKQS